MATHAEHDARLRAFRDSLSPYASVKVANGRVVAFCTLCRGAAYVDRSADNVRDAWREHEAGAKHQRKMAPTTP
jgi:hypothetical protein